MSGLLLLVVSPNGLELSHLARRIVGRRADCRVLEADGLNEASQLLNANRPDLVLLSRSLEDQPDLIRFSARAAVLGAQLGLFLGWQAGPRPGRRAGDKLLQAGSVVLEGEDDMLAFLDTFDPRPTGESSLPQPPSSGMPARLRSAPADHRAGPGHAASARLADENGRVVLIGASTGGIDALATVLGHFPANCPPTAIVQHTGRGFSSSLARVLARNCAARVTVAEDKMMLGPGMVCLAGGLEAHLHLQRIPDGRLRCSLRPGPKVCGPIPSVDTLFHSAVPFAERVIGLILTGMGADGAEGLRALRQAGAMTIGQDEASSVIYGMPRVAREIGAVQLQLPLDQIGPAVLQMVQAPPFAQGEDGGRDG
jgi:hypothetical protein